MSDPRMAPLEQAQGGAKLPDAPALRNLALLASGLTVAAVVVALPALREPAPTAPAPSPVALAQAAPQAAVVATAAKSAPAPNASAAPPTVQVPAPPSAAPRPAPLAPAQSAPAPARLAAAAPQTQPTPQPASCSMTGPPAPAYFSQGVVTGFESREASQARIKVTEAHAGGQIDPAYINNQRVIVHLPNGKGQVLLLPAGMSVSIGDRVALQGGYRNMNLPCNYVPNLITADLGPATPATPGSAGPSGVPPQP